MQDCIQHCNQYFLDCLTLGVKNISKINAMQPITLSRPSTPRQKWQCRIMKAIQFGDRHQKSCTTVTASKIIITRMGQNKKNLRVTKSARKKQTQKQIACFTPITSCLSKGEKDTVNFHLSSMSVLESPRDEGNVTPLRGRSNRQRLVTTSSWTIRYPSYDLYGDDDDTSSGGKCLLEVGEGGRF